MSDLDDDRARALTLAAVGAINRRDHFWALEVLRSLASDPRAVSVAIDTCASILLRGVPRGALDPSKRIPVTVVALPGEVTSAEVTELASDLLTGLACGDDSRVAATLGQLAGGRRVHLLLVLVRAAAGWIDAYIGIDGDTVDAYYAISKEQRT